MFCYILAPQKKTNIAFTQKLPLAPKIFKIFQMIHFLRTTRLKEIVYAAQRLETTCSLTSELIEFLRNFVLPEVDTDL